MFQDVDIVDKCLRAVNALASYHYKEKIAGKEGLGAKAMSSEESNSEFQQSILSYFLRLLIQLLLYQDFRLDLSYTYSFGIYWHLAFQSSNGQCFMQYNGQKFFALLFCLPNKFALITEESYNYSFSLILCSWCHRMELAGSAADALLPLVLCEQDLYQVLSAFIWFLLNLDQSSFIYFG